jgi:hypothetical protein
MPGRYLCNWSDARHLHSLPQSIGSSMHAAARACLQPGRTATQLFASPPRRVRPSGSERGRHRARCYHGGRRDAPIPTPPSDDSPSAEPTEAPASGARTLGLLGLLIELVLPVSLSSVFLLAMATYTSHWDLRTPFGLAAFGTLLVVLSLFVSLRVDGYTLRRREERGRSQLLNRADPRSRLLKLALGGVVIPVASFAAANLVELRNQQTPMSMAIRLRLAEPEMDRPARLADAVLRAESPAAKVHGIQALQATGSSESLDQLLRIMNDDPALPRSGSEYQALVKALASYGAQAKPKLLQRFAAVGREARRVAAAPVGDLFERYFSADFAALKNDIDGRSADPADRAAEQDRLLASQAELKQALSQIEGETRPMQSGDTVPALILQAFLEMTLKQDADVLAMARQTAADAAWPDPIRGQALLLIAKLGERDDLDILYAYLGNPSHLLQARALQAIASLQSKLTAAGSSG